MSLYLKGINTTVPVQTKIGSSGGQDSTGKTLAFGAVLIGIAYFVFKKKKPASAGPDTSDIDAKIRARGLDPAKYY